MEFVLINKCIISALILAIIVIILVKGRKKTIKTLSVVSLLILLATVLNDAYLRFNIVGIDISDIFSIQIVGTILGIMRYALIITLSIVLYINTVRNREE